MQRSVGKMFQHLMDHRALVALLCILNVFLVVGCASIYKEQWEALPDETGGAHAASNPQQDIFVFFDGTANSPDSQTNVRRLFQIIKEDNTPSTKAIYIEGVGTRDKPLSGMILGRGMEERILMVYKFITLNYKPGDKINIFGAP